MLSMLARILGLLMSAAADRIALCALAYFLDSCFGVVPFVGIGAYHLEVTADDFRQFHSCELFDSTK